MTLNECLDAIEDLVVETFSHIDEVDDETYLNIKSYLTRLVSFHNNVIDDYPLATKEKLNICLDCGRLCEC